MHLQKLHIPLRPNLCTVSKKSSSDNTVNVTLVILHTDTANLLLTKIGCSIYSIVSNYVDFGNTSQENVNIDIKRKYIKKTSTFVSKAAHNSSTARWQHLMRADESCSNKSMRQSDNDVLAQGS